MYRFSTLTFSTSYIVKCSHYIAFGDQAPGHAPFNSFKAIFFASLK
jgi:hypothetical protein